MQITYYDNFKKEHCELAYDKLFLGTCMGVALTRRGESDPHVMFVMLVEDDGRWFVSRNDGGGPSSHWLPEMIDVLQEAQHWMEKNCKKDGRHGYKFRS